MGIQWRSSPRSGYWPPSSSTKGTIVNGLLYYKEILGKYIHTKHMIHTILHIAFFFSYPTIWCWKSCHIGMYRAALLISKAAQCSILWIYYNLLYKSSVDGRLVCVRSFAVISWYGHLCVHVCICLKNKFLERGWLVRGYMHFKIWKISPHFPLFSFTYHLAKPVWSKVDLWQSVRQNMYLSEWVGSLASPSL